MVAGLRDDLVGLRLRALERALGPGAQVGGLALGALGGLAQTRLGLGELLLLLLAALLELRVGLLPTGGE